jgi:outer membrane immunogenic protein
MRSGLDAKRVALSLFAATIAVGFGSGDVRAQYAPPPLPSPYIWNGSYVGLNAGVARGADAMSGITTSGGGTMTSLGFTGGAVAGYNWQLGGWVLGVEGDVSYFGLNGTQDITAANSSFVMEHDSFETSWLSTVRGRVGYAWGRWLLYMSGGVAVGDHKYDGIIQVFGISNPSGDVIKVGWSAGIGSEWMFAPGWTTKIEYLHADLGSETFSVNTFPQVSITGHLTEDTVRLGLNYQLGW